VPEPALFAISLAAGSLYQQPITKDSR